jgi:apolipoprotein N-acyltransferase
MLCCTGTVPSRIFNPVRTPPGRRSRRLKIASALFLAAPLGEGVLIGAAGLRDAASAHTVLVAAHFLCGAVLLAGLLAARRGLVPRRGFLFLLCEAPEVLFTLGAVVFLFTYIIATNANMDYVQRFMASGGNIHLAPDSSLERRSAMVRFVPLLAADLLLLVWVRVACPATARAALGSPRPSRTWALPLSLASAAAYALTFPSFAVRDGLPILAYVCLIPLFLALRASPPGWGIFYGTAFGVVQTMLTNYWLGTFNLVSLQFTAVVTAIEYVPFLWASLFLHRRSGRLGFLVFPAAWTLFDFLRSQGFLGYPWGMLGTSQYALIPLIQIASVTGVWGLTFLVVLFNEAVTQALLAAARRKPLRLEVPLTLAAVFAVTLAWGGLRILSARQPPGPAPGRSVRISVVQQDADPRKDDYRTDFQTLQRLTATVLPDRPDLVVWSETAFVPNIRRWSKEDPQTEPLAALVRDFLAYQKTIGTWLLTGNDDYELISGPAGEERLDYNASVLFSPEGRRVETYHKIHLVPFTEYFPFKKQLPGLYNLLLSFDVYLWEPGKSLVVFRHPLLSFSTPICFEDVFPADVRAFVRAGAEVIINLTNDYWSLTEAEAMQHAVNALFRAVENGRPLIRAAASGLTCAVDPLGRITTRAPIYEEAALTVDVPIPAARQTPYTRFGDWFPALMALLLAAAGFLPRRVGRP